MKTTVDFLIIGGGQAGIPIAQTLAKAGKRVALAESTHLGGSCVNFGCIPTKAALASSHAAHSARRGAEFGIKIGSVEVDFQAVLKRAREISEESRQGLEKSMGGDNPKWLKGKAVFTGRDNEGFALSVGNDQVAAKQVVLNTGTRNAVPPIKGIDKAAQITPETWLHHNELPTHLAVIGSGYIGTEMAQFYRRMGSRVTIIDPSAHLLAHEDPDVSEVIEKQFQAEGIDHLGEHKASEVRDEKHLVLQHAGAEKILEISHAFVSTGRTPNTDSMGLDKVGVKLDDHGFVLVEKTLRTSVEGIWAAGDIRGGPMFTHTSWDDYRILESQILGDKSRTTDRIVPYGVFSDPEVGRVGLNETQAKKQNIAFRKAVFELKKNGKAREIGEPEGFIKVLVAQDNDQILGASLVCAQAAELVHIYVELMNARAPYTVLRDAVHAHPTLCEAVQSAVSGI